MMVQRLGLVQYLHGDRMELDEDGRYVLYEDYEQAEAARVKAERALERDNQALRHQLEEKERELGEAREEIEIARNTERLLNAEIGSHHGEIQELQQALAQAQGRAETAKNALLEGIGAITRVGRDVGICWMGKAWELEQALAKAQALVRRTLAAHRRESCPTSEGEGEGR